MDREARRSTVHRSQRVGHDLATKHSTQKYKIEQWFQGLAGCVKAGIRGHKRIMEGAEILLYFIVKVIT